MRVCFIHFKRMNTSSNTLLKNHGLKVTANRLIILEMMKSVGYAVSQNDLKAMLNNSLDKVTVYRTLKTFQEVGIIHEILDGSVQVKYALCDVSKCNADAHIHFKCNLCEKTFCLNSIKIPNISLPIGFMVAKKFVSFQGKCQSCS
mgnify:CR=1 FL=1